MRGSVDTIKEKLGITEIVSAYVKLEKAGTSFKGRCPFHNEKTPSFFVSPLRQSFYCFGCGAKGDIFTFIEEVEGLDFRGSLKFLAEKAGIELEYEKGESRTEKDKILHVLEEATLFFEKELAGNELAIKYIKSRGITSDTIKNWRIGYAPSDWRSLLNHLRSLGYDKDTILKAGLAKISDTSVEKEPYDVFRDRIIFPLSDHNGRIIAFSGRALSKDTEPKYLNSPDTSVFTKSEVLYGLDKAKEQIRKKDYAVLVEGQIDLVLSHQEGINNTVAASGTAFTRAHLERLKHLSSRIILAFDGDSAGEKAAERASELGIHLGFEVKVANLPLNEDPAEMMQKDTSQWKDVLRQSLPAIEFFFNKIEEREKDQRKLGKLIESKVLPMVKLLKSTIEQSHFISMLSKRTGLKEEIFWEDLKKIPRATDLVRSELKVNNLSSENEENKPKKAIPLSHREQIEERLSEIKLWQKELSDSAPEAQDFKKEETELINNLANVVLRDELSKLSVELAKAEGLKNDDLVANLTHKIQQLHDEIRSLEERRKML